MLHRATVLNARTRTIAAAALIAGAAAAWAPRVDARSMSTVTMPTATATANPTDAAAMLTTHCLPCHGGDGAAPIRLDSPDSIQRHRLLAAALVEDGTMPPSIASGRVASRALGAADRARLAELLRTSSHIAVTPRPMRAATGAAPDPARVLAPAAAWTMPAGGGARVRTFVVEMPSDQATRDDAPRDGTPPAEPQPTAPRRVRGLRFSDPAELAQSPIRSLSVAADPRRSMRRLDAADGEPGIDAMGNIGAEPSGALGALSRTRVRFELPAGYHFEVPAGDLVIETTCEPIGRRAAVLPRLEWIAATSGDIRAVRAIAMPVRGLALEGGACRTFELRHRMPAASDIVAVIVKGGAFLRTVALDAGGAPVVEVPDFRMAFNEPWVLTQPLRVGADTELVARLGFDNTADNPQQPSDPPRDVAAGLPPFGEDAIVVVLYAPVPDANAGTARTDSRSRPLGASR
jgi:mono/diheme cytochrome c family protein